MSLKFGLIKQDSGFIKYVFFIQVLLE